MPDLSNWTQAHPSETSRLRDFPALYRSDKSHTRAAWGEEHFFDDGSADSAGVHKEGSGVLRAEVDSASVPSIGTATGEITRGSNTGRLYYTGSDATTVSLSAGTAFQFVVVGPRSIATDEAWVMSWRTASLANSRHSWIDGRFGPYLEEPFVFFSAVTNKAVGQGFLTSFISSMDSSGFTAGGAWHDGSTEDLLGAETELIMLSIGRMPRSEFS